MLRSPKLIFNALLLLFLCSGLTTATQADTLTLTLPDFNGPFTIGGSFPRPTQNIGAYSFTIPEGQTLVAATLTGTFGHAGQGSSAPLDLFLDSLLIAQCAPSAPCTGAFGTTGPTPFTFNFSAAQLALLNDGAALLAFSQLGPGAVRLGNLTLTAQTAVPEPTTLLLLGTGLAGIAARTRRKMQSRRLKD